MMGEEGIKSALEIAMEKISRLPELTPEEIAGQKEREYMPIGEALCQRYLNGAITDKDLSFELEKCHGDKEHIVRRTLVSQGMSSEAAYRFSRGVHPAMAARGVRRGLQLMHAWGGGSREELARAIA